MHSATEPGGTASGPCHGPVALSRWRRRCTPMLASSSTEPRRLRHVGRQPSVPSASMTRATVLLTIACCSGVMLCLREVGAGQPHRGDQDLVAVARERLALEVGVRGRHDLLGVARHRALVEALGHRQRRRVAQQHVEEAEAVDVAARDHQAQRQRRRHEQPDRAPDPAPEDRRDHHRQRRQPGAVAVQLRLDDLRRRAAPPRANRPSVSNTSVQPGSTAAAINAALPAAMNTPT